MYLFFIYLFFILREYCLILYGEVAQQIQGLWHLTEANFQLLSSGNLQVEGRLGVKRSISLFWIFMLAQPLCLRLKFKLQL